jgi:hypothetical protein
VVEGQRARFVAGVMDAPAEEGEAHVLALGEQREGADAVGRCMAGDEEDGPGVAGHRSTDA